MHGPAIVEGFRPPRQARFATGAAVGCNAADVTQQRLNRLLSGELVEHAQWLLMAELGN
jgi:hypothetical protein